MKTKRERNTPDAIVDNDRTVRGSNEEMLRAERAIAKALRRAHLRAVLGLLWLVGGAFAGYVALGLELLRR